MTSRANCMPALDVAVAVVQRDDGRVLMAERPVGKPWAGYWEFPGGKMETGEPPLAALRRELHEELGIELDAAAPWITFDYAYPEKCVRLHFYRVTRWHGAPHGREGQQLSWEDPSAVAVDPVLPANTTVFKALQLPSIYAITNAGKLGVDEFLERLDAALVRGLRLIQVRERELPSPQLETLAREVVVRAHRCGARVLINADIGLANKVGADGVHLPSQQLMAIEDPPSVSLWAASCHNAAELKRASELGADFVVLSPVLPTASHPGMAGMGWAAFAALIRDYPLPVYALGGMGPDLVDIAWQYGAQGVSVLSGMW